MMNKRITGVLLAVGMALPASAWAQLVVSDVLTGTSSNYNWFAVNGACLTAGGSTTVTHNFTSGGAYDAANSNPIPACKGLSYYNGKTLVGGVSGRLPDQPGFGALRLTNGDTTTGTNGNNQTGAVVSNFTFPSDQGLQVTFGTVTYGGNAYPNNPLNQKSGADGITFFLADGSVLTPGSTTATDTGAPTPLTGAYGGSLGYSCSNNKNYPGNEGFPGAYLAVGADEYGNFVNGATVTQTNTTTVSITSTATTQSGTYLTNSSGAATTNPPTWVGSAPTAYPVGTTTQPSTSTSQVVTGVPPNPTSTSNTGSAVNSPAQTVRTGSIKSGNGQCGSQNAYCAQGTYTSAGSVTTKTAVATTYAITNYGDNTASNASMVNVSDTSGPHPGRISVRGAGNVNFYWLNKNYPNLFPLNMPSMPGNPLTVAIQNTCATGFPYNNTGSTQTVTQADGSSVSVPNGRYYPQPVLDYPLLGTSPLPSNQPIYSQEAVSTPVRGRATPITYSLSITPKGILNMSYSYPDKTTGQDTTNAVITNQSITDSNGVVPATFRFGFSAGTGGGSNVHELTCFKAAPLQEASSSAGVNVQQTAQVIEGTQVYLAYYHPTNSWGQLTATNLLLNSGGAAFLSPTANWDASCVLTGGQCNAMGTDGSGNVKTVTKQPTGTGAAVSGTRQLLTWNNGGVPFQWGSLSSAEQTLLDPDAVAASATTSDRLGWLRGDRQNELDGSGSNAFRLRTSVLGDLIDSSPTWVGAPSSPYKGPWIDALYPGTQPEGTSYATFAANNATRTNVVYAGGNDGLMHGFRAGAYNADGSFNSSAANDGSELLGYMPSAALATIHSTDIGLDLSGTNYQHAFFVDATPGIGDLYYNNTWHTWLVSGIGPGGNATGPITDNTTTATGGDIFALDITDPSQFSEANANKLVIGDWGARGQPITCAGDTSTVHCANNLGNTYGTPIIRRLHDGNWGVIFGNGFNSATGTAGIYIMEVSSAGAISFRFLDTQVGSPSSPKNGIAYVSSADLDGDHITDYVYAGDLYGNVWRFDLTDKNPANWAVSAGGPLFTTPGNGSQPITTRLTVNAAGAGALQRVIIAFATGEKLPQTVANNNPTYSSGQQAIYGIWDWNMGAWNAKSSAKYASLGAQPTMSVANLQQQTITQVSGASGGISGFRTVTQLPVCWIGSGTCPTSAGGANPNTQVGWMINLPNSNEQVIYNPVTAYGLFVVNTTIPAVGQALSCQVQPPSGYTMAISTDTGGAPQLSFFANAGGQFLTTAGAIVSGVGLSAVGSPNFVTANTRPFMVNQTATGEGNVLEINRNANPTKITRLNWIELR